MEVSSLKKKITVSLRLTESQILPSLRKHPLNKSYQHGECFADNESAKIIIQIKDLIRDSVKEAPTAYLKSKLNLRNLGIWNIFGRKRLEGRINGDVDEAENNDSTESANDHENEWEISSQWDFSSMNDTSKNASSFRKLMYLFVLSDLTKLKQSKNFFLDI